MLVVQTITEINPKTFNNNLKTQICNYKHTNNLTVSANPTRIFFLSKNSAFMNFSHTVYTVHIYIFSYCIYIYIFSPIVVEESNDKIDFYLGWNVSSNALTEYSSSYKQSFCFFYKLQYSTVYLLNAYSCTQI